MFNLRLLRNVLFGPAPKLPDVRQDRFEELLPKGLTMGTLVIGRPGTGKTTSLARHIVDYFINYPDRGIFVLDWSGSITDNILALILKQSKDVREKLIKRLVYDGMGDSEWVIPLPEFSPLYGFSMEEQVHRVSQNMSKLRGALTERAPVIGGLALELFAPQIFKVLTAIENEFGETWQITEAKKLLANPGTLKQILNRCGNKVPDAKFFLENEYLGNEVTKHDRGLRRYAITSVLSSIEASEVRAKVGYYRPGWTPAEAIVKGLMVLVDGSKLINQRNAQHYLFTQVFSLIMSEINKRQPGNPNDQPVSIVMDEVYSLLSIPGMAGEVGMLSPLYRSRKLELYVVLQSLSQLAPELRKQIWSIGNIVSFAVSNIDEAYEIAQQLFKYDPKTLKLPAVSERGQPITEPDRGQYLNIANTLQRMKHRECIVRRYTSESVLEKYVRYIPKTKDIPNTPIAEPIEDLKARLLRERGVRVRDSLEVINNRKFTTQTTPSSV